MTNIYLVRHAESVANTRGIYQGVTYDTGLSPLGIDQARSLAGRFRGIPIMRIIASPLTRTVETAAFVAAQKNIPVELRREIIETNHGAWEGKHKDAIARTWPWVYRKWQKFPSGVTFPDGERFLDARKRVLTWWDSFLREAVPDTMVVSHDNIIRIIVARVLHMKLNAIWKFRLQSTSVTHIVHNRGNTELIKLGDGSHLEGRAAHLSAHAL